MTRLQGVKKIRFFVISVVLVSSFLFLLRRSWLHDVSGYANEPSDIALTTQVSKLIDETKNGKSANKLKKDPGVSGHKGSGALEDEEDHEAFSPSKQKTQPTNDKTKSKGKMSSYGKDKKQNTSKKKKAKPTYASDKKSQQKTNIGKSHPKAAIGPPNTNGLKDSDLFESFNLHEEDQVENIDPNNPHGFLGEVHEIGEDEEEFYTNIYDEEEEHSSNQMPKIDQQKGPSPVGPGLGGGDKVMPAIMEHKDYPKVPQDFGSLKIEQLKFRIYSHNVKNGGHELLVPGEESWSNRIRKIASSIKFHAQYNTIVALQEVYKLQLEDILKELNRYSSPDDHEWLAYGVGRIDGKEEGEYVPVLFRTSEWELVFSDTIWLNERNPKMALEGWDAKYLRIASFITLKHKATKNYINVFNTHLDHVGEVSRIGSAHLLADKMNEINEWPSFLCGDLNSEPNEKPYEILINSYKDSSKLVTPYNRYGHIESTVTGFEGEVLINGGQNIDYIFAPNYATKINQEPVCDDKEKESANNKLLLRLHGWGMLHSKFNGVYMSDHRPIVADFMLEGKC